jgi:hypothetical protein
VDKYRAMLTEVKDFLSEFKRLDKNMIREMDKVMTVDIPKLLEAATAQRVATPQQQQQQQTNPLAVGGQMYGQMYGDIEGNNIGRGNDDHEYDNTYRHDQHSPPHPHSHSHGNINDPHRK